MTLIKKKEELPIKKTVIGGIYGQPSVGKSTVALSMPRPLLLDTDRGIHRVQYEYRTDSVPVKSYDEIVAVLEEDLSNYDTIVIDTWGKLVDLMADKASQDNPKLKQNDGTFLQKGWGVVKNQFKELIKTLDKLEKNLIFIAHETETTEDEKRVLRPDVSGSSRKDLIKDLDFLGYMEVIGNKRTITFAPSGKCYTKNSLKLDGYIDIPILKDGDANTFLTDFILNPTIEKRKKEFAMGIEYNKILAEAQTIIDKEGVTEKSLPKLRGLKKIGDSQFQIKKRIDEWEKNHQGVQNG